MVLSGVNAESLARLLSRISALRSHLVVELPVVVLAEKRDSGAGQSISLAQLQSSLEGIVQLDLASAASHEDTPFPVNG
jgi:hypothetical protein